MNLPGFTQTAFVTTSLERSMEECCKMLAIRNFIEVRNHRVSTRDGRQAHLHVAVAYLGDTMIELIEPIGGDAGIFRDTLAGVNLGMRFHHVARFFESEAEFDSEIESLRTRNVAFPIDTTTERARVCFADFRSILGCYVELVYYTPEGRKWRDTIPKH